MLPEITQEELSAGLDAMVAQVLDRADIEEPPVNALAVARKLGIAVALDARQRGRARYLRLGKPNGRPPQATVLLRPDPRSERLQWALAHEIGEHLACQVFRALGIDPRETGPEARERIANQVAGRLLLPGAWFAADGAACAWDLFRLKARYATASHELIARRWLELAPPLIVTIFDQGELYFRRSNVAGRVPPLSSAEVRCWRAVHGAGRSHRARQTGQVVRGWPVHEEGWRREILRTELDAE